MLLVAVTYAVATMRMARRGALSQQLNAVESLASTDVICLDKTGTLTEEALRVVALVPAAGIDEGESRWSSDASPPARRAAPPRSTR